MKILPIDATGTLGSRILREAVSHGHEMTGVVRREGALSPAPCVHVVQLDASDAGEVAHLVSGRDTVITAISARLEGDAPIPEVMRAAGTPKARAAALHGGILKTR